MHKLWKNNWSFARQSKYGKLHHSFFHTYGVPVYWFILDHDFKKTPVFIFKSTFFLGYLMNHCIKLQYVNDCMVQYINTILKLPNMPNIIWCVKLRHMKKIRNHSMSTTLWLMIWLLMVPDNLHWIHQKKH